MSEAARRQKGFALLIVLWTLAMLALLGSTVLAVARQDAQLARNLRAAATLRAAAHGAMQQAIFRLLDESGEHWAADDIPRRIAIGRTLVVVRIADENGEVNPNVASAPLLRALLIEVGADPLTAASLAEAMVAWRVGGGVPGRPDATTARYVSAGLAYAPSGAPFRNLDEVGAVLGMTPSLLARLRPHLTVFTDADPDLTTRDPLVARALVAAGQTGMGTGSGALQVVSITADARGAGNARYVEREVVRINARPVGRRYHVLDDEQLWND